MNEYNADDSYVMNHKCRQQNHKCLNLPAPHKIPTPFSPLFKQILPFLATLLDPPSSWNRSRMHEGGEHVWFTNRTIQRLLRYCSYEFLFDRGIEALSSASFFKISRRSAFSSDIFSSRDPPFQDGINKIINNKNLRLEYANAIKILSKDSWKEDSLLGKLRTTVVDGSCVI